MSQTQWQRIAEHYRGQIERGDLGPGARIPSDAKLAEEWSVSRPTAHRALHELQRLGLVIRTKGSGTVVADKMSQATGRVAFMVDRLVPRYNFPHTDMLRGIQDFLGEEVSVIMAQCDDDYRREARQIERFASEVDGIIFYPTADPRNNALIQSLFDRGYPIVALDRFPEGLQLDTVTSDNREATLKAIYHLEALGHKNIGFFSFAKTGFSSIDERYTAYCQALEEVGIDNVSELTRWFIKGLDAEPRLLVDSICDALVALRQRREPITALFCVEDQIASAVLEACDRLSIQIPDDLEIAFFNDWPPMMLRNPWDLHRIVQGMYEIGASAASLLRDRLEGLSNEPRHIKVPAELLPAETLAGTASAMKTLAYQPTTNGGN